MVASWEVREGPVLDRLAELPAGSVQAAITSPPYYGLRAYQGDQVVEWPAVEFYPMPGLDSYMPPVTIPAGPAALGGESDPMAYIGHLVAVFRAVRRVLRDDGLAWINLGDSYANPGHYKGNPGRSASKSSYGAIETTNYSKTGAGLKNKDLIGIPWRAALALQADGWWLRSVIPWVKRNGMPDSATDRPGSAVEWVFLLAKSRRPYYDVQAVKLPASAEYAESGRRRNPDKVIGPGFEIRGNLHDQAPSSDRYRRNSDWWFDSIRRADEAGPVGAVPGPDGEIIGLDCTVASFPGAHFATWPPALVEPMILASTSARGCCPVCGAGWVRVVAKTGDRVDRWAPGASVIDAVYDDQVGASSVLRTGKTAVYETIDWQPGCSCFGHFEKTPFTADDPDRTWDRFVADRPVGDPVPAVVLDPFSGSGTTGAVALSLGRRYIGIELSSEYAAMSRERIGGAQPALFGL